MPYLTVNPLPAYGWVRLAVNYTDLPWTTAARVERVDVATREVTPIRPHTSYSGWYQSLSGGKALLYDTEAPLDRPFFYRTASLSMPDVTFGESTADLHDSYTRTVAAGGWSTADSGQVWSVAAAGAGIGAASQFAVSGGTGNITASALNTAYIATANKALGRDYLLRATLGASVTPTGGEIDLELYARLDASNGYVYRAVLRPGATVDVRISKILAGAFITTGSTLAYNYTSTIKLNMLALRQGVRHRLKLWASHLPEPADWNVEMYDDAFPSGTVPGVRHVVGGTTNPFPWTMTTDEFHAMSLDETSYVAHTLLSQGGFWLRSPLHPAKDRRLSLKPTPGCPPTAGKFFIGMDSAEAYAGNSATLGPVNQRLSTYMSRPRRGVSSSLALVTRTFTDRDEVLDTASDGTALQFAAPPEYGIPTRYLGAGDVNVERGMADHRFQPRVITVPFTEVAQPAGPGTGVTGARNRDLCKTYATWDAVLAAGKTYDDMITVT